MKQIFAKLNAGFYGFIAWLYAMPAHANFDQYLRKAANATSSFADSAEKAAMGGGIFVLILASLITVVVLGFMLIMLFSKR
jgi:hypothetical protein